MGNDTNNIYTDAHIRLVHSLILKKKKKTEHVDEKNTACPIWVVKVSADGGKWTSLNVRKLFQE